MPYYSFACGNCNHNFEVKTSIQDKDRVVCPECGKENPRQIFSGVGFISKSSGSSADMPAAGCGGCCNRDFCGM